MIDHTARPSQGRLFPHREGEGGHGEKGATAIRLYRLGILCQISLATLVRLPTNRTLMNLLSIALYVSLGGFVTGAGGCLLTARSNRPTARLVVVVDAVTAFVGTALVAVAGVWPH